MKSKMQKFSGAKAKNVAIKRTKEFKKVQEKRKKKKETDDVEIEVLTSRLWPAFSEQKEEINPSDIKTFTELPISKKTLEGLKAHNFSKPTDIQRESLMYGLKGHDILGAAKTGSGKTLAFLIPILETLFKQRYTPSFGMAALVISPTRELAFQSFDVLKKIGKLHDLSYGLVTGGMPLREEANKMHSTNVVICTPGRLLQHFEQTPNFTADELKILVLDEADRILHMGFKDTMNAIVEALPRQRQTLLFSATQTKSVKDLARLSLKRPIYVSVHEKAKETTPTTLDQRYIICEMQDKVNMLWSFLRSHRHKKILVFLSCCKQTRYLYQVLRKMHPGLTVLCLHGHMKQHQRMEVYHSFSRKQHAVLLATDVAARGLDFPVVNWVVQLDKPENTDTYIHRVGRTARYEKSGEALLVLLPSEEKKMVEDLAKRKIPVVKLRVSKKRVFDVTKKLGSLCASEKDMKDNAQKAFISVMKTLYVLDKPSFESVDLEAFAVSLGLVQAPKLPFLEKSRKLVKVAQAGVPYSDVKTLDSQGEDDDDDDDDDDDEGSSSGGSDGGSDDEDEENTHKKIQALKQSGPNLNFGIDSDDNEDDDGIYNVVRNVKDEGETASEQVSIVEEGVSSKKKSRAKEKLKLLKYTTRITFDEEGNAEAEESGEEEQGLNIDAAKKRMREQDKLDKEEHRRRVREMHREKRLKEKEKRRQAEMAKRGQEPEEEAEVVLGSADGEGEDMEDDGIDESSVNNDPRRDDSSDEDGDSHGEETDSEDEDEPARKKMRFVEQEEESVEDSEAESDNSGEDSEGGSQTIAKDEEAVLALLGS